MMAVTSSLSAVLCISMMVTMPATMRPVPFPSVIVTVSAVPCISMVAMIMAFAVIAMSMIFLVVPVVTVSRFPIAVRMFFLAGGTHPCGNQQTAQ